MRIPPVAPIFPAIFPKDKRKETQMKVGDLVKEHTKTSKHRTGLVIEVRRGYWLSIKWLDGTVDRLHNIYEVTKVKDGDTK